MRGDSHPLFQFAISECRRTILGTDYVGPTNITVSGSPCLSWLDLAGDHNLTGLPCQNGPGFCSWLCLPKTPAQQACVLTADDRFPDGSLTKVGNKCRNPTHSPSGLWCFVLREGLVTTERCSVPPCGEVKCITAHAE